MRIIVCGGRDYRESAKVWQVLDTLKREHGTLTIIEGGASGADYFANAWQRVRATGECITVRADWRRYGRAAGPIRNEFMLTRYRPALVVAFPGGSGTADMVRRAKTAGVKVLEIPR